MLIVGKTALNYAASGGTANAALTPNMLDAGSVGIYGRDKAGLKDVLIIQGASATGKVQATAFLGKTIRICEGLGGGKFRVSEYIDLAGIDLTLSGSSAYTAPVAWKGYIGYNDVTLAGNIAAPTSTNAKNPVDIRIVEVSRNVAGDQFYPTYYTIEVPAGTAGDVYDEAIVDALVAKINAQDDLFTATKVESGTMKGVKLVAADVTKSYSISVLGDTIENANVSYVAGSSGSGTGAKVAELEKKSAPYRGDLYTFSAIDKRSGSTVNASGTYDLYVISAINTQVPGGAGGAGLAGNPTVGTSVQVTVAFEQPATDAAGGGQQEFYEIMIDLKPGIFADIVEVAV